MLAFLDFSFATLPLIICGACVMLSLCLAIERIDFGDGKLLGPVCALIFIFGMTFYEATLTALKFAQEMPPKSDPKFAFGIVVLSIIGGALIALWPGPGYESLSRKS